MNKNIDWAKIKEKKQEKLMKVEKYKKLLLIINKEKKLCIYIMKELII